MEPGGGHLKKLCVLMALALSLSLGGCGLSGGRSAAEPPPPAQSPSIQRSELSGEEYAAAELLASGARGNSHKLYLPDAGFAEPELFGSEFTGVFALTVEFCSTM